MKPVHLVLGIAMLGTCSGAAAQQTSGAIEIDSMMEGRKTITPDWETINARPLGSRGNPVRAEKPPGQRAYLSRLVCSDGNPPASFRRTGSFGAGPYTTIIDGYEIDCAGTKFLIFMDMYHPGYVEPRPVPPFTIRAPQ